MASQSGASQVARLICVQGARAATAAKFCTGCPAVERSHQHSVNDAGAWRQFESAGVDLGVLAATLQSDGARSFVQAWEDLLSRIDNQVAAVAA